MSISWLDEPGEEEKKGIQTRLKFDLYLSTRLVQNVVKYGSENHHRKRCNGRKTHPSLMLSPGRGGREKRQIGV
jgi:hypothetical protein